MSISGTGAQNDPYIVTTWAELVEKAAESGKYTQVGNDIDVLGEYPDGTMPTLIINGYVDGDGHVLRGMYNTESKHCIVFNASYSGTLTNCEFPNIDTVYSLINNRVNSNRTTITNCKFAGKVASGYILNRLDDYCGSISGCSFNIKGGDLHFSNEYRDNTHMNCNIKMQTSAAWLIYNDAASRTTNFTNCYITISAPNLTEFTADTGYYMKLDNSVLDITTDNAVPIRKSDNAYVTIFNSDHAPNMVTTGNVKGVTTENWLNVSYLQGIGFDIMEVEP